MKRKLPGFCPTKIKFDCLENTRRLLFGSILAPPTRTLFDWIPIFVMEKDRKILMGGGVWLSTRSFRGDREKD